MENYLSIGQIINTHGVKGEVKVFPLTNDVNRFKKLKEVYIEKNDALQKYTVISSKLLKNTVVLKLESIDTVEAAEKLKEQYIKVDRKNAVKLPKDSYFICDLLGLSVIDMDGVHLGSIKDIIQTGSNDVYIVKPENGKEILIPALKSVVKEINIEEGKIIVELPEGLL
ncbi:MAG: ribosome maturation factor RimM [Bacillota bacterium]